MAGQCGNQADARQAPCMHQTQYSGTCPDCPGGDEENSRLHRNLFDEEVAAPLAFHKMKVADLAEACNVVQSTAIPDNQKSATPVEPEQDVFLFHVFQKQPQVLLLSQPYDVLMKSFFVKALVSVSKQDLHVIGALAV